MCEEDGQEKGQEGRCLQIAWSGKALLRSDATYREGMPPVRTAREGTPPQADGGRHIKAPMW